MLERAEEVEAEIGEVQHALVHFFEQQQEADQLEDYKTELAEFVHAAHQKFQAKYFSFTKRQIEAKTRDLVVCLRDFRQNNYAHELKELRRGNRIFDDSDRRSETSLNETMIEQKHKLTEAAHDLLQQMVGDPVLRMYQIEALKESPQWTNAERALRDAVDRIMDHEDAAPPVVEKPEQLSRCKFWVFAIAIVAMVALATLSAVKLVDGLAGPTYKEVPAATVELQHRALANSLSHAKEAIGKSEAILEGFRQETTSFMDTFGTERAKVKLLMGRKVEETPEEAIMLI